MNDFESDKTTSLRKSFSMILTFGVYATDDIEEFQFFVCEHKNTCVCVVVV